MSALPVLGVRAQISVRVAVAQDVTNLERLRDLAAAHISSQRGGVVALLREFADNSAFEELTEGQISQGRLILIGLISETAVGYCFAESVKLSDDFALCQIQELFVESEARDVGVGQLLMDSLTAWAVQQRCGGIDATVMPGDRETKNFFETFGLVARAISVHLDLPRK